MAGELFGFVGTGRMGGPMTIRLLAAGYRVCIYDRDQKIVDSLVQQGAERATSPADVASRAETIFLSLPNPEIVNAVALGKILGRVVGEPDLALGILPGEGLQREIDG